MKLNKTLYKKLVVDESIYFYIGQIKGIALKYQNDELVDIAEKIKKQMDSVIGVEESQ